MASSNELRVFISSTFRDLQEEREHLVKKIFPEIRALCRQRGITFTEVDLRWGLTEEQLALGQVIRTCLEEVERCRPYFIGITGDRYGYVPDYLDIQKDADLLRQFPWVEQAALDAMSISEMEAQHAILRPDNDDAAKSGARFYFRRQRASLDDSGDEDERTRLEAYQQRIRRSGVAIEQFRDPVSLGAFIYDDLIEIIKRDFADARPPSPLEEERSRHTAFAASRRHAYIANPEYLKRLNEWYAAPAPPLIIYAESGSGKSSLVSFWCDQLRRRQPDAFIVEHYVGIGTADTDHLGIIRHVMSEIKERYNRTEEIPTKPQELESDFANWLGFISDDEHSAPMLLVLDGINQLTGHALSLSWLPRSIPDSVRLIISSTVEHTLVDLRARGWESLGMQPLKEREREAMVVRFLSEYHKSLSVEQTALIAEDVKCAHPLFLRTLLEEIRLYGTHEHLDRQLAYYLGSTGTEDLFQRVLERLESDFGTREVREVMQLLYCSRSGLSEAELSDITGFSRLKLAALVLALDYHLVRRDGLLTFFHDYLRRAVAKRYLSESNRRVQIHQDLAEHFRKQSAELRTSRELVWQLHEAGDRDGLAQALSNIDHFMVLYTGTTEFEVQAGWAELGEAYQIDGYYRQGIEQWRNASTNRENEGAVLGQVSVLLEFMGRVPEAIVWQEERLALALKRGDRALEAKTRSHLGYQLYLRGMYPEALEHLKLARTLCEEVGDLGQLGYTFGNIGNVHNSLGEYDDALACHRLQEEHCRAVGDRRGIGNAFSNQGTVYANRREFDRALECMKQAESLYRAIGDRRGIGRVLGNAGNVHSSLGEYDKAIECYRQAEQIARELGDRQGAAIHLGNRGLVHFQRAEFEEGMACAHQAMEEHRAVGFPVGLTYWLAAMSEALVDIVERSVDAEAQGAEESVERHMPAFLQRYLPDATDETWRARALARAQVNVEECRALSEELQKDDTLTWISFVLPRIEAAQGNVDQAIERLTEMLANADRDEQRALYHYSLWKLSTRYNSSTSLRDEDRVEALRLYTELAKAAPEREYTERIEELTMDGDTKRDEG